MHSLTPYLTFKKKRGWRHVKLYSDVSGDFTRDYVTAEDSDRPAFNVFARTGGTARGPEVNRFLAAKYFGSPY